MVPSTNYKVAVRSRIISIDLQFYTIEKIEALQSFSLLREILFFVVLIVIEKHSHLQVIRKMCKIKNL